MTQSRLDSALDELYGVEPAEFVATRQALVARLRGEGDPEAAAALGRVRRPTKAAWAINQVSRRAPAVLDEFVARSRELRAAQERAVAGEAGAADEIRRATAAQRDALAAVVDAVLAELGGEASDPVRGQAVATLQAAAVDDALADQLRQGRLVREVKGTPGFPAAGDLDVVPGRAAAPRRRPGAHDDGGLPAAESAVRDAQRALDDAAAAAEAADAEVEQRRVELEEAREAARDAGGALRDARKTLAGAERLLERVRRGRSRSGS